MTTALPSAPTTAISDDPRVLRLVSVLPGALPPELGTPAEPDLYTVSAVFSRQVSPQERARIEDPATARQLAETTGAGPGLQLTISDRRLLIHHTNLAQLKDGLAAALAGMLERLGAELFAEQDRRAAEVQSLQVDERERSAAVERAAAEIRFEPGTAPGVAGVEDTA